MRLIKILILLIFAGILIFAIKTFLNIQKSTPINTSNYTNVYSNGWYGYTVRFPSNYYILYGNSGIPGSLGRNGEIITSKIDFRDKPMGKGYPCTVSVITGKFSFEQPMEDLSDTKPLIFNGITWHKLKYTSLPGNALYEYKGVKWQAENGSLVYLFQSSQDNERQCESIVSTLSFSIDQENESAKDSEKIKKMAIDYASNKFPDLIFNSGAYVARTPQNRGESVGILNATNEAIVTFIDPSKNNIYENSKNIFFSKVNRIWQIASVANGT